LPDHKDAAAILSDVPTLITSATHEERQLLLLEIFDVVYLMPHQVMAVRPAAAYTDMLERF
jgi:hypothetical protein